MKNYIKCEKCKSIIGELEADNKNNVKSIFFDNSIICSHCKGEFCKDCYSKMKRCYCCGQPITKQ